MQHFFSLLLHLSPTSTGPKGFSQASSVSVCGHHHLFLFLLLLHLPLIIVIAPFPTSLWINQDARAIAQTSAKRGFSTILLLAGLLTLIHPPQLNHPTTTRTCDSNCFYSVHPTEHQRPSDRSQPGLTSYLLARRPHNSPAVLFIRFIFF